MRTLLHRAVWQKLPREFRRKALFRAAQAIAPRPTKSVAAAEPYIVAGPLRTASGLGQSARLCYASLKMSGFPVFAADLTRALNQPADLDVRYKNASSLDGPGTLILHVNAPYVPLALAILGRRFIRGKHIIGYWHWELEQVPSDWNQGISYVHEAWVPTRFTRAAVQKLAPELKVEVLPHPVAAAEPALREKTKARTSAQMLTILVILNVASGFERKNPLGAIEAFRSAFGNDESVRLIVKIVNGSSYPAGTAQLRSAIAQVSNASLIEDTFQSSSMVELYGRADVIISLHRSEGFGLVIAEGMLNGIPVVATDWSGPTDFLSEKTGFPIKYRLVPAEDPQGMYHFPDMKWAHANVDDAASKLRQLLDPDLRTYIGESARRDAIRRFSADAYNQRIQQILGLEHGFPTSIRTSVP